MSAMLGDSGPPFMDRARLNWVLSGLAVLILAGSTAITFYQGRNAMRITGIPVQQEPAQQRQQELDEAEARAREERTRQQAPEPELAAAAAAAKPASRPAAPSRPTLDQCRRDDRRAGCAVYERELEAERARDAEADFLAECSDNRWRTTACQAYAKRQQAATPAGKTEEPNKNPAGPQGPEQYTPPADRPATAN